jgi:hypothetical protein
LVVGTWELNSLLLNVLRQSFQLLEEHEGTVRRNLEPLPTRSARDVVIDADQMVFALAEQRAIAIVGPGGNLRFLRPSQPADGIVVRATAARTLKAGRPLLRFLGEELTLVHVSERTTIN